MRRRAFEAVALIVMTGALGFLGCAVGAADEDANVEAVGSAASRGPQETSRVADTPPAASSLKSGAAPLVIKNQASPTPIPWYPNSTVTDGTGAGSTSTTSGTK